MPVSGLSRRKFLALAAKFGVAGGVGAAAIWRGHNWLRSREEAPVVVIGSGAAGIAASFALLEQGVPVVMTEAGFWDAGEDGLMNEEYRSSGKWSFPWYRIRQAGGKLNQWLAHCPRFSPADFSGRKQEGFPWPVRYEEVAPYYTRIERILGVIGEASGEEDLPDGEFVGTFRARVFETDFARSLAKRGLLLTQGRYAVYPAAARLSRNGAIALKRDRSLERRINFYRPRWTLRRVLLSNPSFSLLLGAQALRLEIGSASNRPEAITFINRATGQQESLRVRSVVLAAGCLESTKLLLHSTTERYPAGLGNTSGTLGRYLTDHTQCGLGMRIPATVDVREMPGDGIRRPEAFGSYLHAYTAVALRRAPELAGMYSFQVHGREADGDTTIGLNGMAVMEPRAENRMRLTGELAETGVPIPEFRVGFTDEDLARRSKMLRVADELLQEFRPIEEVVRFVGTSSVHYAGTCRMGSDPGTSMCDATGALHEIPLVHVADASVFVCSPEKNPTLTLMALAWRSAEHLASKI
jgi:choline dehydrogenase-like flavoprotein